MAIEQQKNDWPPRIEGDSRLNPILPLVNELNESVRGTDQTGVEKRLLKLGNALVPHVQSRSNSISIADFIQIGDKVTLTKGQYWSFEIEDGYKKFSVERRDVWSGGGVSLQMNMYEWDEFCLGVLLQKDSGKYYLNMGRNLTPWGVFGRVETYIAYESSIKKMIGRPRIWRKKD
jgi:hypothetical protein